MSLPTDGELLRKIRAGDRDAEAALYERHRRKVVLWVISRTGDPHAEDNFQEAYTRIFLPAIQRDYLRDTSRVERFLRTITLRLTMRLHKRNKEHVTRGDFEWEDVLSAIHHEVDDVSREESQQREELALLRQILEERCSPEERELHRRHWIEGIEIKELARQDGIGEEALRKRHSRLLIWLRQQMADGLWDLLGRQLDRTPQGDNIRVAHLQRLGLISEDEVELLSMRYVRKRGWDVVARHLARSEREAAEHMLTLLKRIRLEV